MIRAGLLGLIAIGALAHAADPLAPCHALDDVGDPAANACYDDVLKDSLDESVRAEAYWRLGDLSAANAAFRMAVAEQPGNAALRARWGHLYLAAHQFADAEALFQEALELDDEQMDAMLGLAELFAERFESRAEMILERVFETDPTHPDALVLLARLHLEVGKGADARALLEEVLENDPPVRARLAAYALLAAADHVDKRLPSQWTERALALNPRYGDAYAVPAHFYVITRRYREAVALLERAVAVDADHWQAHTDLGINLLRLNRFEQAREHLEDAYAGDPFNAEVVNTLRLLDSLSSFDELTTDELVLRIHKEESPVLRRYVRELVDETIADMAGRYGYEIERPIVIELYQHHDDFAVRTAGLPGLGILGATFGDVIVMDGPSAKTAEQFDWYSALWHELAHVVTLNATDNQVSRWFAEGVSVYEEWRYGPTQGLSLPLHFLEAMRDGRLLPVGELDEGFIRPKYPDQIGVSYLQAGLVCQFIADNYEHGLRRVLQAYAEGHAPTAAVEQGLGVAIDDFDAAFKADLEERLGPLAAALDEFKELGSRARDAVAAERWSEAAEIAAQAEALYPAYVGAGSPYLLQAQAAKALGMADEEVAALERYWRRGGRSAGALKALAQGLAERDDMQAAVAVRRSLVRTVPLQADPHAALGELLNRSGQHEEALAEYQAVLALGPHDLATAHYNVAATLHALDEIDAARSALLQALEIAPRFKPALALLLKMRQSDPRDDRYE